MPSLDQALATLINDLSERGMLEKTLVMVSSEFGRTPKINNTAGRDHWPKVFSVMLAGGGVKGGAIYGSSNATAAEPEDDPVSPADLATTMYHLLGIVADKELMAPAIVLSKSSMAARSSRTSWPNRTGGDFLSRRPFPGNAAPLRAARSNHNGLDRVRSCSQDL